MDDTVPVTVDGRSALAFSSDKLELWPFILAKAIYTVYSACGYSSVVGDVQDHSYDGKAEASEAVADGANASANAGDEQQGAVEREEATALLSLSRAQCVAQFTSFVLHVMTGTYRAIFFSVCALLWIFSPHLQC